MTSAATTIKERRARRRCWNNSSYHAIGIVTIFFFFAPIAVTFLASFRPGAETGLPPLPPWPVNGISLDAYHQLDSFGAGVLQHTMNSLFVSLATVLLTVLISLLAGY